MESNIIINGRVIAILEEKGKIISKISCNKGLITIPKDRGQELRLNDLVTIEGKIFIDNISFDLTNNDKIELDIN